MISVCFLQNKTLLQLILRRFRFCLGGLKYSSLLVHQQRKYYSNLIIKAAYCERLLSISTYLFNMATASSSNVKTNRLSLEKSPYLLQHATNPVDWFPWGEEAFQKARDENKIIFLSVGYSTCHWCHVMEKESFENDSVAAILNADYICIKVDREERPDVDRLYMSYVQRTTGSGGWPMSVFLTPSLAPLFGGTYFPPEDHSYGRVGFKSLLKMITEQWKEDRNKIGKQADESMTILRKITEHKFISSNEMNVPHEEAISKCLAQFTKAYEPVNGGFSHAPKFPQPSIFGLLLHIYARDKDSDRGRHCLEMCTHTLTRMAYGGIHDHVNKGFARYSVDAKWHVPHFEKMLYDQAQIAAAYCDVYVVTKDPFFADQVQDVLDYVGRDLGHPMGGFYGAEDADSYPTEGAKHKQEGAFCVWEWDEINNLLDGKETSGVKHLDLFCSHYSVEEEGNVDKNQDPHGELKNKNVLSCFGSYDDTADKFKLTVEQVKSILADCHQVLYDVRQTRPKPHVDTKIVTSWNGLMIGAFAKAGFALNCQRYIERAEKAATFIKEKMYDAEAKTLMRCCYGEGDGTISQTALPIVGFLDDYAFLIRGILGLYEATLDSEWLKWAEVLQERQDDLFWDAENSGYFTSPSGDSSILIRDREDQDGAEPCGNSVAVYNLIRLAGYLDRQDLREKAGRTLTAFSDRLKKIPFALPEMISALMAYHESPTQVFIAGPSIDDQHTQALLDVLRLRYHPGRLVALADGPQGRGAVLYTRHDTLATLHPVGGRAAAYVCRNFACALPVTEPAELARSLDAASKP